MVGEYTKGIQNQYLDYTTSLALKIRERIFNMDVLATEEDWKSEFEAIKQERLCSVKRYLASWLESKASENDGIYYTFTFGTKEFRFLKVTEESINHMSDEERNRYISLFTSIAADNSGGDIKEWKPLFWKAMLRKKGPCMLTKDESLQIAHGLRFSFEEAEDFLIRAVENEGFMLKNSADLIHVFCFLHAPSNNMGSVNRLLEEYKMKTKDIAEDSSYDPTPGFTYDINSTFAERVKEWERNMDLPCEELFMRWMVEKAPKLDFPSNTSKMYYRRLAAMAFQLFEDDYIIIDDNFTETIESYIFDEEFDIDSDVDLYFLSDSLLKYALSGFDNNRRRDINHVWRYLTVDETGSLTAVSIGDRIPQLLMGKIAVTKADMLFLLWLVCFRLWEDQDEEVYDRICGYWDLAETILENSMLPVFYAPHSLERSFLNAICSSKSTDLYPFEIYEAMCEFVLPEKQERKRTKKETTKDEKTTKEKRKQLKKITEELYCNHELDFEGLEMELSQHMLENAKVNGKYEFSMEGIRYLPNPAIIISLKSDQTVARFDKQKEDYKQEKVQNERFQFIYGLSLYMEEVAAKNNHSIEFRINYKDSVTLTILQWN